MEKIVLSHVTGLRWLLGNFNARADAMSLPRVSLVGARSPGSDEAAELLSALGCEGPLHCLVPDPSFRRPSKNVRCHVFGGDLPRGSLIPLPFGWGSAELYVCCPELIFLQLAGVLDEPRAIYCGMALCSSFRLESVASGGVVHRSGYDAPLTNVHRIGSYLRRLPGSHGSSKARRALGRVADGARSPRECSLGMLFCLPSRLGGFDLGDLSFNVGFRVYDGMDRDGNPRSRIRVPDILIASPGDGESRRLAAIDYDPDSTHAGEGKIIADQRRRNEIATITSLPHFTITSDDARDFSYLCSLAERVRKVLGRPLRPSLRQAIGAYESQRKLNEAMYRRSMLWRGLVLPPFEGALTGSHRLFE